MEVAGTAIFRPNQLREDGLVHISQISDERVANVSDHLELNQEVTVKVMEVDRQGRVRLSIKEAQTKEAAAE